MLDYFARVRRWSPVERRALRFVRDPAGTTSGSSASGEGTAAALRPFVGRIVATSFGTEDPAHLAYQERNRTLGRMSGQLRLRVRYRDLVGPWFEYLIVSPEEMTEIVCGTGWSIRTLVRDEGSYYVAVLE